MQWELDMNDEWMCMWVKGYICWCQTRQYTGAFVYLGPPASSMEEILICPTLPLIPCLPSFHLYSFHSPVVPTSHPHLHLPSSIICHAVNDNYTIVIFKCFEWLKDSQLSPMFCLELSSGQQSDIMTRFFNKHYYLANMFTWLCKVSLITSTVHATSLVCAKLLLQFLKLLLHGFASRSMELVLCPLFSAKNGINLVSLW